MCYAAVGVASYLAVVRPPRVECFNDPSQAERDRLLVGFVLGAASLDVEFVQAVDREPVAYDRVVVAAVEVQRVDVREESVAGDGVDGWFQQADVMTVRAVDCPADRNAVTLDGDGPFPTAFASVGGVCAGSFAGAVKIFV